MYGIIPVADGVSSLYKLSAVQGEIYLANLSVRYVTIQEHMTDRVWFSCERELYSKNQVLLISSQADQ